MNRREFLKLTALAGASFALIGDLPTTESRPDYIIDGIDVYDLGIRDLVYTYENKEGDEVSEVFKGKLFHLKKWKGSHCIEAFAQIDAQILKLVPAKEDEIIRSELSPYCRAINAEDSE